VTHAFTQRISPRDSFFDSLPLWALGTLTVVLGAVYSHVFAGEICGDDNTYHFAEAAFLADAFSHGDFDLWNPSANGGFPSGYYYQLVPAAIPGVLAALFGNVLFWFQLTVFLSMVLVPAATYRGLRMMGADPWPAFGGAVASCFFLSGEKWGAGAEGVFWVGLYTQGVAMCAYPLAVGYGYRWITESKSAVAAVGWGLFVGLSHPVAGVGAGIALTAMLPVALVEQQQRAIRSRYLWPCVRLGVLGLLYVVGSASAWVQVIVDYEAFGGFPHRVKGEDGPGFEGLQVWLRNGHFLDHERPETPRVLTALMVPSLVLSLFLFYLRRWRYLAALWLSAFAFAYIIAGGRSLKTADDLFPAVRVLGPLQLALTMVIGAGCVSGVVAGVRALDRVDVRPRWVVHLAQGALAFLIGLALVCVVATAAGQHYARVKVAEDYPRIHRKELDQLLPAMRAAGPGRIQNRGGTTDEAPGVENHWFIILPSAYVGRHQLVTYGAAGLQSSTNFVYLWETPNPIRSAWIYDAPLVLTNHQRGPGIGGTLLASTEHFELRELPSPGLVSAAQVVGEIPPGSRKQMREVVLRWQRTDQPMHEQLLAWPGSGIAGPPPDGDVLEVKRGRSQISFKASVRKPTTYLVREGWHPRWVATIDGMPSTIRRVSPDMMALDIEPGEHTAVLRFERPLWQWLLWLCVPLAMLAGWIVERLLRRRVAHAQEHGQ
jgi:hypothetical protein